MTELTGDERGSRLRGLDKDGALAHRWMAPLPETVLPAMGTLLPSLRFWVGLAIMAMIKVPLVFHGRVRVPAWAADAGLRVLLAPAALAVSALVVVTVYLIAVRHQIRGELLSRLWGPLTAFTAFFGHLLVVAALWLGLAVSLFGGFQVDGIPQAVGTTLFIAVLILAIYATARLLGFMMHAIPAVHRYMFRTMEIHPALPALITVGYVWEMAVQDLLFPVTQWPDVPSALPLGGATTATLLAVWEIHRLRTRHGVRLGVLPPPPR
ncbi:hypothetical protein ACF07V_35105 [Streptomyces sp. NPDC015661]|uniref:hypothetical protein n=1 Tax=Streptomyces sp. NPDC015661 TaxID=3364961 RepID=UPI0036FA023A